MFQITHNKTPHWVKGAGLLQVKQLKLSDPQTQVCYVTATPDDLRPDIVVGSLPTVTAVVGKGTPTMPFFFGPAFVYRNSYLVQGQDAVPYFRTKINRNKLEGKGGVMEE